MIVNRVWGWHFGRPLVATASDFGTQGDKPTHPELLDDLAARFIEHGWSLKWLNKEIMLSAAYQQSSHPREDGLKADEANALLWRRIRGGSTPKRIATRLCVRPACSTTRWAACRAISTARPSTGARSTDASAARARRRCWRCYDFPEATQTAPDRDVTTSTLQQIFLMNSEFIQNLPTAAAKTAATATGEAEQIGLLYRRILARDPRRRDEERARVSAERARCSAMRRSCCRPTRRFSFHELEADAAGNDRSAGRRPRCRRAGRAVCRHVEERGPRGGPGQLSRTGAAGRRPSTSSCST